MPGTSKNSKADFEKAQRNSAFRKACSLDPTSPKLCVLTLRPVHSGIADPPKMHIAASPTAEDIMTFLQEFYDSTGRVFVFDPDGCDLYSYDYILFRDATYSFGLASYYDERPLKIKLTKELKAMGGGRFKIDAAKYMDVVTKDSWTVGDVRNSIAIALGKPEIRHRIYVTCDNGIRAGSILTCNAATIVHVKDMFCDSVTIGIAQPGHYIHLDYDFQQFVLVPNKRAQSKMCKMDMLLQDIHENVLHLACASLRSVCPP